MFGRRDKSGHCFITIVVIVVVQAIVENIGSDSLVNGVTGAIDGITAWPPNLSNIGRVTAVFHDPVDISTTGLVISGTFNVVSTCDDGKKIYHPGCAIHRAESPEDLRAC